MRGKSHFTPFLLGKEISQLVESLPGEKQHCVLFFITNTNPGAAPHACNPSTQETKTMSFLEISGQTFQHIGQCNFSTLSQNMVDSNWERHLRTTVILHLLLRTTAHTCDQEEHTNSDNQCACTTHINTLTLTLKSVIHLHKNLNFNLLLVNTRYFCTYLRTRFSWQGQKSMQVCFTQNCVSQSTCWERAMEVKLWGPHHCASTDDSSDGIFRLQKVRRWLILCILYCFLTPPASEI